MASYSPKWFHGDITREDAEHRIVTARERYPGQALFLVRKSSRDPNDFVLTCCPDQPTHVGIKPEMSHLIIRVTSGDANFPACYTLQTGQSRAQPTFNSLEQLLQYYKSATAGAPAPIGTYVPAPRAATSLRRIVTSSEASQPPSNGLATASAAAAAAAAAPVDSIHTLAGKSHPSLAPPAAIAAKPEHQKPATGLSSAEGGGLFNAGNADMDRDEELLCEGYLEKHRGVGKTRKRWFALTNKKLTYYTKDAGEVIASCLLSDISAITDLDKKRFRIVTREAFGTGNHTELIIEAPNQRIKNRWLFNLRQEENSGGGFRGHEGRLMVEGALIKVQPVGTTSKTRWFVVTDRHFSYYKEEGGEIMGSVLLENITTVGATGDKCSFKVMANTRFTVTGSYEVVCRCPNEPVRNKWLAQMQRVIPREKFPH